MIYTDLNLELRETLRVSRKRLPTPLLLVWKTFAKNAT